MVQSAVVVQDEVVTGAPMEVIVVHEEVVLADGVVHEEETRVVV